jgi:hypothetical protein
MKTVKLYQNRPKGMSHTQYKFLSAAFSVEETIKILIGLTFFDMHCTEAAENSHEIDLFLTNCPMK